MSIEFFEDWNILINIPIKLILALICSAAIGFDREVRHRPAGLRTHVIVCLSATLIMAVGILLKDRYISSSPSIDPTRLAAQIISGIGFLGAGTIIKGKDTVKGLTTAATLWGIACIGIAIGAGYYITAVITSILILFALRLVSYLEKFYIKKKLFFNFLVELKGPLSNTKKLNHILESHEIQVLRNEIISEFEENEDSFYVIHLQLRRHKEVKNALDNSPQVIIKNFKFVRSITNLDTSYISNLHPDDYSDE